MRRAELRLTVEGEDGFRLEGASDMSQISRDPEDIVRQTIGANHQYPDGFVLYLGTMFAPTEGPRRAGAGVHPQDRRSWSASNRPGSGG